MAYTICDQYGSPKPIRREDLLALVRTYAPYLPQSEAIEQAYLNGHILLEEYKFLAKGDKLGEKRKARI